MEEAKISIIIPVYNTEKFLKKCVNSVTSQTYKNLEIILINDGSTDKSAKICNRFAKKDKRIKVIHQNNKGASAARNAGIKVATGEYLSFVDSDDWIHKLHYEILINDITTNEADMSCSMFQYNNINYHKEKTICVSQSESYSYIIYYDKKANKGFGESSIYGKLFKTEIAKKSTQLLYDEKIKIGEDFLWLVKYIERCKKISFNYSPTYAYLKNDNQQTANSDTKDWYDFIQMKIDYYRKINAPKKILNKCENEKQIAEHNLLFTVIKDLKYDKNKPNMLFITRSILGGNSGGTRRTEQNIAGCELYTNVELFIVRPILSNFKRFFEALIYKNTLITRDDEKNILEKISNNNYKYVFIDNSLYGKLCKKIQKKYPKITVIVHYHNVEEMYWKDEYRITSISLEKIIKRFELNAVKKGEKIISKKSNVRIFISNQDKENINFKYKNNTSKDIVIPPCLKDNFKKTKEIIIEEPYVIFVGSAFYANCEAINFIIKEIAPNVNIKTVILGNNLNKYFTDNYKNIEIIPDDENWNELMNGAIAFISPIFSGSGAKIKICEALMYGKKIIGTKNSFTGYNMNKAAIQICESTNDFIDAYNKLDISKKYFEENRRLFENFYNSKTNKNYYKFLHKI